MGKRGDAGAREALIGELGRNPSSEVIEALALVADDDVVVHLGRCAARHPALAGTVLDILRDMESAKAERLARHLPGRVMPGLGERRVLRAPDGRGDSAAAGVTGAPSAAPNRVSGGTPHRL